MDEVNGYAPGETILPALSLVDYWDRHYLPWATTNLKPSTRHGYEQAFNQHLKLSSLVFAPHLSKTSRPNQQQKFLGQLAQDGQGERTISHTKWIASGIFKHAIATGFATENPWPDAQCLAKTQPPTKGEGYQSEPTWSRSEKANAWKVFDAALKRELRELMQETKLMAGEITKPADMWALERGFRTLSDPTS